MSKSLAHIAALRAPGKQRVLSAGAASATDRRSLRPRYKKQAALSLRLLEAEALPSVAISPAPPSTRGGRRGASSAGRGSAAKCVQSSAPCSSCCHCSPARWLPSTSPAAPPKPGVKLSPSRRLHPPPSLSRRKEAALADSKECKEPARRRAGRGRRCVIPKPRLSFIRTKGPNSCDHHDSARLSLRTLRL